MSNYLSTVGNFREFAANLTAARAEVGSGPGSGDTFLKIDKQTGAITFGQEATPLPPHHRFVLGLHEIYHGYLMWDAGAKKILSRHTVPMAQQPVRPVPPGGAYGDYKSTGPRDALEIRLCSIDEPGFNLMFTAWGSSSGNRIGRLLDAAVAHLISEDGKEGFIHPVVNVKGGNYVHKDYGIIHHIDFDLVDWLNTDGQTLLSQRGAQPAVTKEAAPWDEDEDMTDAERELLGAAE